MSTAALGGLAAGLASFTVESAKAADQARVTELAFVNLSGGSERAAANLAAMERATGDLISEQKQQAIANQLLGMEIVSNATELEKVVGVSRRLGKEFRGMGAAEAANEFAIMIANMSYQRLDTFGISSGIVRKRVNEMAEAAGRAATQQDFFNATMEEADRVLTRLGPELETTTNKVERLASRYEDFQVAFGELFSSLADAGGIIDGLTTSMEQMTRGAEAWSTISEQVKIITESLDRMNEATDSTSDSWQDAVANFLPFGQQIKQGVDFIEAYVFNQDRLKQTMTEVGQELENARNAQKGLNVATEDGNQLAEEQAERLEELAKIRRDFARDLIRIDEQAQEDVGDTWDDYFDDEQDAWKSHTRTIADLKKRHAKDLARVDKDLTKDLTKITTDENKQIERLKSDAAKEEQRQAKIRQIDTLADQRLFDFEMQQLAAEGQGNAIRAALERRAIEEQIAREKADVEQEIEDEKLQDEIERVRTGAEERRRELRDEAAEERQLREQELAERLAAEDENYQERLEELRQYREEKLVEIENSRQEAIVELGRELAEAQDLTRSELQALVPVAGQLGEEAGKAYAEGMLLGFQTNQRINQLLGQSSPTGAGGFNPLQAGPGSPSSFGIPGFQFGGIVPGPIGQPRLAVVHGGETVTPPGQGFNINVNGIGANELAAIIRRKVEEGIQEYQDTVLVPVLA